MLDLVTGIEISDGTIESHFEVNGRRVIPPRKVLRRLVEGTTNLDNLNPLDEYWIFDNDENYEWTEKERRWRIASTHPVVRHDGTVEPNPYGKERPTGPKPEVVDSVGGDVTEELNNILELQVERIREKFWERFRENEGIFNWVVYDETQASIIERLEQQRRGAITFNATPDAHGRVGFTMDFLAMANRSTFFHEFGHMYLEMMRVVVANGMAPKEMQDDFAALMEWLGVKEGEAIPEWAHEKFARGFEKYLGEGKAPSARLRTMFATFSSWLKALYTEMLNLNVELTDDVRGVMDRMLASDEEIQEAQFELGVPMPDHVLEKLSDAQRERYERRVQREREEASLNLTREVLKRTALRKKLRREQFMDDLRAEVEEKLNTTPAIIANANMQDGQTPEGEPLPEGQEQVFLDRESVLDMYGPESPVLAALADMGVLTDPSADGVTFEGGLTPNQASETFGMGSGDELLRSMVLLRDKEKAIEQGARALFEQRAPPELLGSPEIKRLRTKVAASNERSERLLADYRMLQEQRGQAAASVPTLKVIRARAARRLEGLSNSEILPHKYQRSSRYWSRKVWESSLAEKWDVASEAKMRELLNHEMHRLALKIQDRVQKDTKRAKTLGLPRYQRRAAEGGFGYRDHILGLLERFGLANVKRGEDPRQKPLEVWLKQVESDTGGLAPDIAPWILNESDRRDWSELTPEELHDVRVALDQIYKVGTGRKKLLDAQRRETVEQEATAVKQSIANWAERTGRSKENRRRNEKPGVMRRFLASHRTLDSLAREIDNSPLGALYRNFVAPMFDAQAREVVDGERINKELERFYGLLNDDDRRNWAENPLVIPGVGESLTLEERILVALNHGNKEGRARLLNSFTADEVQLILGSLEQRHANAVKVIVDLENSFWPESRKLWELVKGVAPPKVEPVPFTTTDPVTGEAINWAGGYHRIKYEGVQELHEKTLEQQAQLIKSGQAIRATTKSGSMNERLENVDHKLRLNMGVVTSHLAEVVHMNTHLIPLRDMQAVLAASREDIVKHLGEEVYHQFREMYLDLAGGTYAANDAVARIMSHLRAGTSVMRIGWRLTTNMINISGISQSFVGVGQLYGVGVAEGTARVTAEAAKLLANLSNIKDIVAEVNRLSPFMDKRQKSFDRELHEQATQFIKSGKLSQAKAWLTRTSFAPLGWTQMMVDLPTWMAAYKLATEKGETQEGAVKVADDAVIASQGGGRVGDMAKIMRGNEFQKLFTVFYSYASRTMNLAAESTGRTKWKDPASVARWAAEMLMLLGMPAVWGVLIQRGLRGDEPDEPILEEVGREMLAYGLGMFVFTREVSGSVLGMRDYGGPAGAGFFGEVQKLGAQLGQGELDDTLLKRALTTGGILLHLPTTQLNESYRGLKSYLDGDSGVLAPLVGPARKF
jgi:hypothetical protein